jgi:hypothetical protein
VSVWPSLADPRPTLAGREGTLISVAVNVDPRYLEVALEALAQMSFPINPQIYHQASIHYVYPDGREEAEPVTLVEFPAYESRLPEVRRVLAAYGFPADAVHVTGMLDGIHSESLDEPAPAGAGYVTRRIRRHAQALTAGAK